MSKSYISGKDFICNTKMDKETIIVSEVNQGQILWYNIYVELNEWYKQTYLQEEIDSQILEKNLSVYKVEMGRGIEELEF